ncbi:hypothetical protein C5C31_14935 [Rathayibacter rathayi]|uniref:hypothetical protein n=1 Tax=Rathayibacter rathayi TaxID=33887 RepID=UPI000CE7706F|nr:hypothetical protein [Rathayibacter rathayi]PPG64456.1 hypothetical protein C5C02_14570 [Rathayibacter rathayi]PPG73381.1 hypothetical protein C5C23_14570 [Rathayibacter rathayi]PPH16738.1 hypothetical protein C5C31_14935 [Rathayibacter rathayi]PPI76005.1 hypothetical protein C5E03_12015 [Rathayibacter rathayi]
MRLRRARLGSELRTFLGRPNPFDDDQDDYWTAVPETAETAEEQLARMRANILAAISDRHPLEETVCHPDTPRKDTP